MSIDSTYLDIQFSPSEIPHSYGEKIHLLSSPALLSLLSKVGHPETTQPQLNFLMEQIYSRFIDIVVDTVYPKAQVERSTRMKSLHPEGVFKGKLINEETSCVVVDLARAGTLPSQICYQKLNFYLRPDLVRQDHFYIARVCNKQEQVIGEDVSGSKIGGGIDQSIVLFPDPMGATGGTIQKVYEHYQKNVPGIPLKMIALHLIVTPEYLKKVTKNCPDLDVFALRLDRGLSSPDVLNSPLGSHWDQEVGLNHKQYIVPGAGGVGEILNNSFC